ncbi:chromatin-remodeling ATPase INO80, partial [Tachysurus ichikawai]
HEGSCFSFLRFIDVSPAEMSNVMQGTLARWLALYLSFKAAHRLHHRRLWSADTVEEEEDEKGRGGRKAGSSVSSVSCCLSKSDLILWPDRSTSFPNTHNSTVLQELVFTSLSSWIFTHTDVSIHSRRSNAFTIRRCQPTQIPKFLLTATPMICGSTDLDLDLDVTRPNSEKPRALLLQTERRLNRRFSSRLSQTSRIKAS